MTNLGKILIFLVDDDELLLKSLEIDLKQFELVTVETYLTGEECLKMLSHKPDIIILDYHLDGIEKGAMNGLETLDKIKAYNPELPVIILSCQDLIEVAVDCMKHNAYDYIVKSETAFLRLQRSILSYFEYQKIQKTLNWYIEKFNF